MPLILRRHLSAASPELWFNQNETVFLVPNHKHKKPLLGWRCQNDGQKGFESLMVLGMPAIHKDLPSTWMRYKNGLCHGCNSGCCTMPVEIKIEDLLRLKVVSEDELQNHSLKKIAKGLMKSGLVKSYRADSGLFTLSQKANDDCIFLNENRLCSVYEKRPGVCREFPSIGPRPGFCPAIRKSARLWTGASSIAKLPHDARLKSS